jgi:hypothetical protein
VDKVIKKLQKDRIPCFVTSTVISELELLKVNGRISEKRYINAMSRWKRVKAKVIDFKNRLLSSEFIKECQNSMTVHHGTRPQDIVNDCRIIVVGLQKGVDLFISEDFHFTSKRSDEVFKDITNIACQEYHIMCDEVIYTVDTKIFIDVYNNGKIDITDLQSRKLNVKKAGKHLY